MVLTRATLAKWRANRELGEPLAVTALIIALVVALSVFGINLYRYGDADHSITIPFIKYIADPTLYPGDLAVRQWPYYQTPIWPLLGMLGRVLHLDIPSLFFAGYVVALYLTCWAIYDLALTLSGSREVALLSLFFLLLVKSGVAEVPLLDSRFVTRAAVLPFLLFSFGLLFKERYVPAYLLLGVGFVIHPLTGVYAIAMIGAASLAQVKQIGIKRLFLCMGILALVGAPIALWKLLYSTGSSFLLAADPRWVELMRLRSAHHVFPFSWGWEVFLQAGLQLGVFLVSWKHKPAQHRLILAVAGVALAMLVAGVVFSELYPLSIFLQLQLFRSFPLLVYFILIYYANYFWSEIRSGTSIAYKLGAALVSLFLLYSPGTLRIAAAMGVIGLAGLVVAYRRLRRCELPLFYARLAIIAMILLYGVGAVWDRGAAFSLQNAQPRDWLEVQRWAKENTPRDAAFIVPPRREGFRVESERTVYVDWKEGTLMFFNPQYGYEWYRRMQSLGFVPGRPIDEGYDRLDERNFAEIVVEAGYRQPVFIVTHRRAGTLDFPAVYENESYRVYRLTVGGQ